MKALQRRARPAPAASTAAAVPTLFGIAAEFESPETLLEAAHKASAAGYTEMDAYTPFPVEGLSEAVGFHKTRLPLFVLIAGLTGLATAFCLIYYQGVIDYPYVVQGRPTFNWQPSVPIFFELTILFAAFTTAITMVLANGLPRPYHPIFNTPGFELASTEAFFLCIESKDPKFDRKTTRQFLESLHAKAVSEVES